MSEILFEFVRRGNSVKVTAIDPDTKTEAVVIVPASLSPEQMKLQALRKLEYIMKKDK